MCEMEIVVEPTWSALVAHSKEASCQCRRRRFSPRVREIPWGRKQQPTQVFLPGKFHGQRSLLGYSPWVLRRVAQNWATKQQTMPGRVTMRIKWLLGLATVSAIHVFIMLEEGMATHSSILAWRIAWTEKPGGLQTIGSKRVRHNWSDLACTHGWCLLKLEGQEALEQTPQITCLSQPESDSLVLNSGSRPLQTGAIEDPQHFQPRFTGPRVMMALVPMWVMSGLMKLS